jgi:hypothetical protein
LQRVLLHVVHKCADIHFGRMQGGDAIGLDTLQLVF